MQVINFLAILAAFLFALPLWIVTVECCISLFVGKLKRDEHRLIQTDLSRVVILIPAHNEARVIAKTLRNLTEQFPASSSEILRGSEYAQSGEDGFFRVSPRIVVVADNCTDNTAEIARQFDVTVLERQDAVLRGKGYALDFGIQFLKHQPEIDVVVMLDADCFFKNGSLAKLSNLASVNRVPVQAINISLPISDNPGLNQKIASFAWLVKNKIRPLAVSLLNLPVTLTGTGMAFPWHLMTHINLAHGHIVEDMQLGIDLTLKGYPPLLCHEAEVFSYFPEQQSAQKKQRTRWEHGHLMTIIEQVPRLIKQAVINCNLKFLALALDLAVPPLALLVLISLAGIGLLSAFYVTTDWLLPIGLLLASFVMFVFAILVVWWREGQVLLSFADLCSVPVYIVSKLSVYCSFIWGRQKDWVRTERDDEGF